MTAERTPFQELSIETALAEKLEKDFLKDGLMMAYMYQEKDLNPIKNLYLSMQGTDVSIIIQADENDIDITVKKGNESSDYLINQDGVCEILPEYAHARPNNMILFEKKHRELDDDEKKRLFYTILGSTPDRNAIKGAYSQLLDRDPFTNHYFVWVEDLPGGLPFPLPFPVNSKQIV